jgi:hypothetical protein
MKAQVTLAQPKTFGHIQTKQKQAQLIEGKFN